MRFVWRTSNIAITSKTNTIYLELQTIDHLCFPICEYSQVRRYHLRCSHLHTNQHWLAYINTWEAAQSKSTAWSNSKNMKIFDVIFDFSNKSSYYSFFSNLSIRILHHSIPIGCTTKKYYYVFVINNSPCHQVKRHMCSTLHT